MNDSLVTGELLREPLSLRGERLYIEDCDTVALAEQFGTPLYVVSESQLRNNVRRWRSTFEEFWPAGPVRLYPSLKANPIIAIHRILTAEKTGCDIFGPGELECAIRAGVAGDDLSVNGSIKDRGLVRKALEHGARIILDSPRELDLCEQEAASLGTTADVLFRLKPDISRLDLESDFVPGMQVSYLTQIIKYGIPTSEAREMATRVAGLEHVRPVGVHVHMGRHSKRPVLWDAWVRAWHRIGTFRGEAAFVTWMHRLTVNLLLDRKRRDAGLRQRMVAMDEDALSQLRAPRGPPPGATIDLERAVAGLPEGARLVFVLHEVEGFKHREIADRLGVAVGTVKAQLHRARRLLMEALER